MRSAFLLSLVSLITASPVMADIGSVTAYLTSPDDNGPNDLDPRTGYIDYGPGQIPATISVHVWWSATTEGPDGPNRGIYGAAHDITGSALGDNTIRRMVVDPRLRNRMGVSTTDAYSNVIWTGPRGLGFDGVLDLGTGGKPSDPWGAGIFGFGAFQAFVPDDHDFGNLDAQYVGHPSSAHPQVAHNSRQAVPSPLLTANEQYEAAASDFYDGINTPLDGPGVHAFNGSLVLSGQPGDIILTGEAALWFTYYDLDRLQSVSIIGSQLWVLPEPATLVLAVPLILALLRRRRA